MPNILALDIIPVAVMMVVCIACLIYVVYEYKKSLQEDYPDQSLIEHAREKSTQIIQNAIKKSQEIVSQAEIDEIKVAAESRLQSHKLEEQSQKQMATAITQTQQGLTHELTEFDSYIKQFLATLSNSHQEYLNYLNSLKGKVEQTETYNQEFIASQVNKLFEKFEQQLMNSLAKTEQESIYAVELEIKAARQLIDLYKQQQLKLVDENIIAVLERTLSLVLAKKLTLQDQMDLVYEALEKAKAEKFIT
jgi:hypothetical protein